MKKWNSKFLSTRSESSGMLFLLDVALCSPFFFYSLDDKDFTYASNIKYFPKRQLLLLESLTATKLGSYIDIYMCGPHITGNIIGISLISTQSEHRNSVKEVSLLKIIIRYRENYKVNPFKLFY